jgi:sensor c-di-GMP phosphodiesterase-like protein
MLLKPSNKNNMKKLLAVTVALLFLGISIMVLQSGCSKTVAQQSPSVAQLNKLIFTAGNRKFYSCNYDGSNISEINFTMPGNYQIQLNMPSFAFVMSPDGQKLFFTTMDTNANGTTSICSTNISGSGFTTVVPSSTQISNPIVLGAY